MSQKKNNVVCERFRVLATDNEDKSYFVARMIPDKNTENDFFWCNANQPLVVGELIEAYVGSSSDSQKMLTLVKSNGMTPTFAKFHRIS
jgi:hypothetical protein